MRFQCPFCQGVVAVPNSDMGVDVQCGHCGEVVSVPTSRIATGSVISDFIIQEELGRGGMGVVYLTHQITLDRSAALKVLAGAYANNPEFVVDFIKEARAAAKLNHPHIVQAYAVGEDEGIFFFAMEHIDGETMKDYMKREGVIKVEFALEVVQQIAEALDYAWKEQRLVHRDIKPDNIMLTRKGRAKLADLGLARVAGDIDDADSDEVMGTPQYISPEHLTGAEMDVRSDIYSLGATLFHLITGRFAFEGRTATDIARKHLEEPLISPREVNPKIPDSVCRIIFKMMAKNVNERYQSAEDLVEDLRLARQGKKPTSAGGPPSGKGPNKQGKQFSLKKAGGSSTGSFKKVAATSTSISLSAGSIKKKMTSTGTDARVDQHHLKKIEKERKAKVQMILMLVFVACVVVVGGIFIILNINKKPATKKHNVGHDGKLNIKTKVVGVPKSVESHVSNQYIQDADKVLAFAKKNIEKPEDVMKNIEHFFSKYPAPKSKNERLKRSELMAVYVPLDEKRVQPAREKLRKAHLALLEARKESQMSAAKIEEANRLKQEQLLKEQERLKALEARRQQVLLEKEQKNKERIAEYVKTQHDDQDRARYLSLSYSKKKQYKDAAGEFAVAIKEVSRVSDLYKKEATKISEWGTKMKEHVDTAAKMWDVIANSGKTFKGMQIEIVRGSLAKILEIKNGNVFAKTMDDKDIRKPISDLPYKQLKRILLKAETELLSDLKDPIFHYLFCDAQFVAAKEFLPDGWMSEMDASAQVYALKRFQVLLKISDTRKRKKEMQNLIRSVGRAACIKAKKSLGE
jgi:serine/threonine protein kinase